MWLEKSSHYLNYLILKSGSVESGYSGWYRVIGGKEGLWRKLDCLLWTRQCI